MNYLILILSSVLVAVIGLVWAILWIQRTNTAIASAWPDWEGIKNPLPLWVLFGFAVVSAAGGALLFSGVQSDRPSPSLAPDSPSFSAETEALKTEVARLKELLSEATRPALISHKDGPEPAPSAEPPPAVDTAGTKQPEEVDIPIPEKTASTPSAKQLDPRIEEMSRSVIKSVISGSVKPLEEVAHKTLMDQFTIDPFHFTQLQFKLKARLEEGYTPTYLDVLKTSTGAQFLWKIETVKPGPDILERLAISDGKVTGFRFDGLQ